MESLPFTTTVEFFEDIVYLEHVVVTMTVEVTSGQRGEIQIVLTSPSGTESILLGHRGFDGVKNSGYFAWPFMSVMFWGENPAGKWTLSVQSINDAVVIANNISFQFYGTSIIPQAVANIPDQCHTDCVRGCAAVGSEFCDSCINLRNAESLECIDSCPMGYTKRNGYCYYAEVSEKTCNTALKQKVTGKKMLIHVEKLLKREGAL